MLQGKNLKRWEKNDVETKVRVLKNDDNDGMINWYYVGMFCWFLEEIELRLNASFFVKIQHEIGIEAINTKILKKNM